MELNTMTVKTQTPKTSFVCIECGHHFRKALTRTLSVICPKCHSADIEPA